METVPSPKKISKEELKAVSNFLSKHNFSSTTFTKTVNYSITHYIHIDHFQKNTIFTWPFLKDANEVQMKTINDEINELKKTHKIFEKFELRTKTKAGDTFVPIPEISKVFGDDEKMTIEHQNDQILLIYFWATW